jgi:hypothetical protein
MTMLQALPDAAALVVAVQIHLRKQVRRKILAPAQ